MARAQACKDLNKITMEEINAETGEYRRDQCWGRDYGYDGGAERGHSTMRRLDKKR